MGTSTGSFAKIKPKGVSSFWLFPFTTPWDIKESRVSFKAWESGFSRNGKSRTSTKIDIINSH